MFWAGRKKKESYHARSCWPKRAEMRWLNFFFFAEFMCINRMINVENLSLNLLSSKILLSFYIQKL